MKTLFVTGGIGSGKSTVASHFAKYLEEKGYKVVVENMDDIAKDIYNIDNSLRAEVQDRFGMDCYFDDPQTVLEINSIRYNSGKINRGVLASRIFQNEKTISLINSLVHPKVYEHCERIDLEAKERGVDVVIKESALYPHVKIDPEYILLLVDAPRPFRVQRVVRTRKGMTEEKIIERMEKQADWASSSLRNKFAHIIENDSDSFDDLALKIEKFANFFLSLT